MFQSVLQAVFPSLCACCGDVLVQGERQVCLRCLNGLNRTHYSPLEENPVEKCLAVHKKVVHATAMFHFQQSGNVQRIIHTMKFRNGSELCVEMGRQMGLDLLHSGLYDDVDLLLPVPLHWSRRLRRGYNQSELLCRGITLTFPRPLNTTALVRHRRTKEQSRRRSTEREHNVSGAFRMRHPGELQGHHILLVDDVMTTGATLNNCIQPLSEVPDLRISVAILAVARL